MRLLPVHSGLLVEDGLELWVPNRDTTQPGRKSQGRCQKFDISPQENSRHGQESNLLLGMVVAGSSQ
jgi:hypothetical protein